MLEPCDRSRIRNVNGFIKDPLQVFRYFQATSRSKWTDKDKQIFREKFAQRPKDFVSIAAALPNKTVSDCIHHYYATKHQQGYKALVKRYPRPRAKPKALMRVQTKDHDQEPLLSARRGGSNISAADRERKKALLTDDSNKEDHDGQDSHDSEEESAETHECHACRIKLDNFSYSRAIDEARAGLFGIENLANSSQTNSENNSNNTSSGDKSNETNEKSAPRVCHSCWSNKVNYKCYQCPLPTCRTPKRKLARLKALPHKWPRLAPDVREAIVSEFGIPATNAHCCANCFQRIRKRIHGAIADGGNSSSNDESSKKVRRRNESDPTIMNEAERHVVWHAEDANWTSDEIEELKTALANNGRNWQAVSEAVGTRTASECKNFYFSRKSELRLDLLIDLKRKYRLKANRDKESKEESTENDKTDKTTVSEAGTKGSGDVTSSSDLKPVPPPPVETSKNKDGDNVCVLKVQQPCSTAEQPPVVKIEVEESVVAAQTPVSSAPPLQGDSSIANQAKERAKKSEINSQNNKQPEKSQVQPFVSTKANIGSLKEVVVSSSNKPIAPSPLPQMPPTVTTAVTSATAAATTITTVASGATSVEGKVPDLAPIPGLIQTPASFRDILEGEIEKQLLSDGQRVSQKAATAFLSEREQPPPLSVIASSTSSTQATVAVHDRKPDQAIKQEERQPHSAMDQLKYPHISRPQVSVLPPSSSSFHHHPPSSAAEPPRARTGSIVQGTPVGEAAKAAASARQSPLAAKAASVSEAVFKRIEAEMRLNSSEAADNKGISNNVLVCFYFTFR